MRKPGYLQYIIVTRLTCCNVSKNFRKLYVNENFEIISTDLYASADLIAVLYDDGYGWFLHHDNTQHITVSAAAYLHIGFTVRKVA
jgi:hypothetical protein